MANNPLKKDLLATVLADRTPEERARVLDLVRKMGVSEEDELWLICLAIGQLQILIQDGPQQWQSSFDKASQQWETIKLDFTQYLESWATRNTQIISQIKAQNDQMIALTASMQQLKEGSGKNFQVLTRSLSSSTTALQQLNEISINSDKHLSRLLELHQEQQLAQNKAFQHQADISQQILNQIKHNQDVRQKGSGFWKRAMLLFALLILGVGMANAHSRIDGLIRQQPINEGAGQTQ